ncbi:hypothetical protein MRO13_17255 [Vibrio metschnikovii]|uniref:hypothetical protein n=1 Tax=Vibrio metschnikovii TaxID=28172 RepID=UPI00165D83AF|nr:hypothetical protein [Vibrio metschnikovii]EKO3580229.1 hypothetical protein [Vibrio metschnikovii]EKO3676230.1 hypothetical protein [Vibrio metschnikovii]EKO3707818.1 hypothetical protein [Vibrio metschnikovii]
MESSFVHLNESELPAFIARSVLSLDDFLDSDISMPPCFVYCQFERRELCYSHLRRLSASGVSYVKFSDGAVFHKEFGRFSDKLIIPKPVGSLRKFGVFG